jgi:hypothetical protein
MSEINAAGRLDQYWSDDQQSHEQKQRAREPYEERAFEEFGRQRAHLRNAQHDDAGDDDEPRPHDPRERAGSGSRFSRRGH